MADNFLQGVLLKAHGGFYFVQAEGRVWTCSLRGRLKQSLRNEPLGLLVGDKVLLEPLAEPEAVIAEVMPRQNFLVRPRIANLEQCLIVLAAEHPKPDYLLLDRLLVCLLAAGIRPIICFNKLDKPGAEQIFAEQFKVYQQAGFTVLAVSALQQRGVAELQQLLQGKITAVAGQSGVGKSTLLNQVQQGQQLQTGGISRKLQRGRHTTRLVELLPLLPQAAGENSLAEGWIADTPGFSRLAMPEQVGPDNLAQFWPDLQALAQDCRFDGCRHDQEPDCRVKAAVAEGLLDARRYQRYLVLLAALSEQTRY